MPFRKTAAGAHLRPDGCTRSATLLTNQRKTPHCRFWDNTRTVMTVLEPDIDALRPARGILPTIRLAIPFWVAMGILWWLL